MSEERSNKTPGTQRHHFGPGHGGPAGALGRPVEKAKDFRGTLRRLLRYLRPHRTKLAVVALFAVLGTIFTIVAPRISGNAMNALTNGFIAKQIVSKVSSAQETADKEINKQLDSAKQQAYTAAKQQVDTQFKKYAESMGAAKADAAVEQQFGAGLAAQKQQAYAVAVQKADAAVEQQAGATAVARKQQAYAAAILQADAGAEAALAQQQAAAEAAAEKQAREAVDQHLGSSSGVTEDELKAAEDEKAAQAKAEVDAGFAKQLPVAKATAEAKAKAMVDQQFAAQQSTMDAQLAAAKQAAEAQAKATVDQQFAAQQAAMDARLAGTKKTAEAQAISAVDQQFAKPSTMDPTLASKLNSAEQQAKKSVEDIFTLPESKMDNATKKMLDQFLSQSSSKAKSSSMNFTPAQFDAVKEIVRLPLIKNITDANQKADTIQKFIDLTKKMPAGSGSTAAQSKTNFSSSDMTKYLNDVRETNGKIPFGDIGKILLMLLGVYALSASFTFVMQFVMSSVAQRTVFQMRKDINDKLARLPLKYFDGHTNGEILSRMTNDIDTISSTLQQSLTQLIQSILQIIGYAFMMLLYSRVLTLIVLATLPLYVFVTMFIAKRSQKYYARQQKHLGELSGHTEEMFTGHKIVRVFGHEEDSIQDFEKMNDELYDAGWKAQFVSGIMFPLMNFISNVGYVLISVVGGIFVTKNLLNIGDITAFIQYSRSFSMPITQTANIANIIQSTIACAERVFEVLDEEEEEPDPQNAPLITNPRGEIHFEHVQFSYKPAEPLMEDMNLNIRPGQTIAIVGPTGAGKTTLVNLLMRFYEIQGGQITFDDTDIRRMQRGNLRTMFGMVLQDTWLFNGTIEANIAYGREGATHADVVRAAKAAHADHFIRALPEGYDTVLNEEASNISQGQKQLLTIARAILADPAVLILDEATSSVDTRTELLIQHAMAVLMKGRTNFVIAHRLSTIRDADLILVMNHGTIIEQGTHESLLADKGFYADLYNSQFTGASIDEEAV